MINYLTVELRFMLTDANKKPLLTDDYLQT